MKTGQSASLRERALTMVERYAELYNDGNPVKYVDFQEKLGISQGKLQSWLRNAVKSIKEPDARRLSKKLKMNIDYIMNGQGEPFMEINEPDLSNPEIPAGNISGDSDQAKSFSEARVKLLPGPTKLTDDEIEQVLIRAEFLLRDPRFAGLVAQYIFTSYEMAEKRGYMPKIDQHEQ